MFGKDTGINLIPCYQVSEGATYQGDVDYNEELPLNNFSSKYTLTLSSISDIKMHGGKSTTPTTNLKITYGNMIAEFKDSKKQNSIKELANLLLEIFKKVFTSTTKKPSEKDSFDIASKWAQKRSGDWLQVLACMDLATRTFQKPDGTPVRPFEDKNNVYFLTHDQIALAYALFVGVNAIFVPTVNKKETPDKRFNAVVFKRASDSASSAGVVPQSYESYCESQLAGKESEIGELTTFLTGLQTSRNTQLQRNDEQTQLPINTEDIGSYETSIKTILRNALEYSFVEHQVPDVTQITNDLAPAASAASATNYCRKYKAYVAARKLREEHKDNPDIQPFLLALRQTDRYKLLENWTSLPSMSVTKRIANMFNQTDERDLYMFLPDIANSKDEKMKNRLAVTFHGAFEGLNTLDILGAGRTKNKRLSAFKQLFSQIEIFLGQGVVEQPEPASAAPVDPGPHFRDAIGQPNIEKDDTDPALYNLLLLANVALANLDPIPGGRLPDTGEAADTAAMQGGQRGGYAERIKYYIQGTSIKTITLPLLTAHLLYGVSQPTEAELREMGEVGIQTGGAKDTSDLPILLMLEGIMPFVEPRMEDAIDNIYIQRFVAFLMKLSEMELSAYLLRELFFTNHGRKALFGEDIYGFLASTFSSTACGQLTMPVGIADFSKTPLTEIQEKLTSSKSADIQPYSDFEAAFTSFHRHISERIIGITYETSAPAPVPAEAPVPVSADTLDALAETPLQLATLSLSEGEEEGSAERSFIDTLPLSGETTPISVVSNNSQTPPQTPPRKGGKTPRASKSSRRTRRARRSGRSTSRL
jgi:hypothetical protein